MITKMKANLNIMRYYNMKPNYSDLARKYGIKFRVHQKSIKKLKAKLKYISGRSRIGNIKAKFMRLKPIVTGGVNYFKLANMKNILKEIDKWLRRRIRMAYWKQWKKIKTKFVNFQKLGVEEGKAWEFANTGKGY